MCGCHCGGLLGHWACLDPKGSRYAGADQTGPPEWTVSGDLLTCMQVTDCNAAFFDAANQYAGSLPESRSLRRQGLLETLHSRSQRDLSAGQSSEIDRVYRAYPALNDDDFIRENLSDWLK